MAKTGILALGVFAFYCIQGNVITVQAQGDVTAKELLSKMQERQDNLKNYECSAEYIDIVSTKFIRSVSKNFEEKGKNLILLFDEKAVKEEDLAISIERQMVVMDNSGREKVESEFGYCDLSTGKNIFSGIKCALSWDGNRAVCYSTKQSTSAGGAIIGNVKSQALDEYRQPWQQLGGSKFIDLLKTAIDNEYLVDIEYSAENQAYKISISYDNQKTVGYIDTSKEYILTREEEYVDNKLVMQLAVEHKLVNGVWFPKKGTTQSFFSDDPTELRAMTEVLIEDVKINVPVVSKDIFEISLPDGTYVEDTTLGMHYRIGDLMSMRVIDTGSQSLDQINSDKIKSFDKELVEEQRMMSVKELFIPKASVALERGIAFVLDLNSGNLINVDEKPDSEKMHKYLSELKKGDIAWEDSILTTHDTKVLTIEQKENQVLDYNKGMWADSCKLSSNVKLPYRFLAVNKQSHTYLIEIREILQNKVKIIYRKLTPEEAKQYQ